MHLDAAGHHIGIDLAPSRVDGANDTNTKLTAQLAGLFKGVLVHAGIKDHLGETIAVPQVDKDAATMITAIVYPAGERNFAALVGFSEYTAAMRLGMSVEKTGHCAGTLAQKKSRIVGFVCHNEPQMHIKDRDDKAFDVADAQCDLSKATPHEIVRHALQAFGAECAIAFSGSDDVALLELASQTGLPFSVVVVDTGRLHAETYRFIEQVRAHYGIEIHMTAPEPTEVATLVRTKGLFSFLEDGHQECCQIRKVKPLRRALQGYRAWMTGQRKDQNLETRAALEVVEVDAGTGVMLAKFNPLANWSHDLLWQFIRDHQLPHNALHRQGFSSIGCEPCTRPVLPGQHEREGRWWWEDEGAKECGLHAKRHSL